MFRQVSKLFSKQIPSSIIHQKSNTFSLLNKHSNTFSLLNKHSNIFLSINKNSNRYELITNTCATMGGIGCIVLFTLHICRENEVD